MKKLLLESPPRRKGKKRTIPIPREVMERIHAKAVEVYGTGTVDELRDTSIKGFKLPRQAVVVALIEAGKRRGEKYSQQAVGEAVGFQSVNSVATALKDARKLKGEEKEMLEKVVNGAPSIKTPDIGKLRNEVLKPGEFAEEWKRQKIEKWKCQKTEQPPEARPLSVEDGILYAVWVQGRTTVAEIASITSCSETEASVVLVRVAELLQRETRLHILVQSL